MYFSLSPTVSCMIAVSVMNVNTNADASSFLKGSNSLKKWLCNRDYQPGNRAKQFQETHTITVAKFECKTLVVCEAMQACCISFKLCRRYCLIFLELFGPIVVAIISIMQSLLRWKDIIYVPAMEQQRKSQVALQSKHCYLAHLCLSFKIYTSDSTQKPVALSHPTSLLLFF